MASFEEELLDLLEKHRKTAEPLSADGALMNRVDATWLNHLADQQLYISRMRGAGYDSDVNRVPRRAL